MRTSNERGNKQRSFLILERKEKREIREWVRLKSKWIFLRLRSHFQEQYQHDNFLQLFIFLVYFPPQHNTTLAFLCLFPYACFVGMLKIAFESIYERKKREKERISPRKKERGSPSYSGSWFSFALFFFFCRGFSFGLALSLENSRVSYQLFPHPYYLLFIEFFTCILVLSTHPTYVNFLCIYIYYRV